MFAIYLMCSLQQLVNYYHIVFFLLCRPKLSLWLLFCSTSPPNSVVASVLKPLLYPILYICIWLSNLFLLCCIYTKIKRECFIIYYIILLLPLPTPYLACNISKAFATTIPEGILYSKKNIQWKQKNRQNYIITI